MIFSLVVLCPRVSRSSISRVDSAVVSRQKLLTLLKLPWNQVNGRRWSVIKTTKEHLKRSSMSSRKRGRVAARTTDSERSLRQKAEKTLQYLDSDSDDEGGRQNFNLEDKLNSTRFPMYLQYFVKELKGEEVNIAYFQK